LHEEIVNDDLNALKKVCRCLQYPPFLNSVVAFPNWRHVGIDCKPFEQLVYVEKDVLKWRGFPPKVSIYFDEETAFLIQVTFFLNRSKSRLSSQEVFKMFIEDLTLAKVITVLQSKEAISRNKSISQLPEKS
jgi:hypothetical protein